MAWQSDAVVASNGEAILLRFLTPFGMTLRDEIASVVCCFVAELVLSESEVLLAWLKPEVCGRFATLPGKTRALAMTIEKNSMSKFFRPQNAADVRPDSIRVNSGKNSMNNAG